MAEILTWLEKYSAPVVVLLVLAGALLYVLKLTTEKAISAEFNRYTKDLELKLERRSNFEERILLERYSLLRDIDSRFGTITTDINRLRAGQAVGGLYDENEIVPLTTVFELLNTNRYLLTDSMQKLMLKRANNVLSIANAKTDNALQQASQEMLALQNEFHAMMVDAFALDRIGVT
jgi:hypothetical protein